MRIALVLGYFCGPALAVRSVMDLNKVFLTPETDMLPAGTYIATGLSGVMQLAAYLDANPDTKITHLLLSDSTVQDLEIEVWPADLETTLNFNRVVSEIAVPLQRVLDKAAPSLEALAYLTYIGYARINDSEWGDDARIMALLRHSYPSLTQLSFRNSHMYGAARVLGPPPQFPALTHLHFHKLDEVSRALESLLADFPHLTHLRITDAAELPAELYPISPTLDGLKQAVLGLPYNPPPLSIPENLTIIVHPGFSERRTFCGMPGIEYDEMIQLLADSPRVHVMLFPTMRTIALEFISGAPSRNLWTGRGAETGSGLFRGPDPTGGRRIVPT
ncbi:hypothetical protein C8R44DRAFT_864362 [Mycena epipterygia]|nr:hypothetical protein C8R44DRAFT_864362 [Mycena epipterygia]